MGSGGNPISAAGPQVLDDVWAKYKPWRVLSNGCRVVAVGKPTTDCNRGVSSDAFSRLSRKVVKINSKNQSQKQQSATAHLHSPNMPGSGVSANIETEVRHTPPQHLLNDPSDHKVRILVVFRSLSQQSDPGERNLKNQVHLQRR